MNILQLLKDHLLIECFKDGSFIVGQKTALNFWKNNESI